MELGDRTFHARAVVTEGEERDRLYGIVTDGAFVVPDHLVQAVGIGEVAEEQASSRSGAHR